MDNHPVLSPHTLLLIAAGLVLAATSSFAVGDEPKLEVLQSGKFGSDTLARSANVLIELGEEEGVKLLHSLAKDQLEDGTGGHRSISVNERIGWLCRVVFLPNKGNYLHSPPFGALSLPYKSMSLEDWHEYPVVIADGVIFVLDEGYLVTGPGANAHGYLDYCQKHGHLRKDKFRIPTRADAKNSLKLLIESPRWKNIRWSYTSPDTKYRYSEDRAIRDLSAQVERIAN